MPSARSRCASIDWASVLRLAILCALCGACGGGTAAIVGSGGGGGSGGSAKPALGSLSVESPKPPSADIAFTLTRPQAVKLLTLEVVVPAEGEGDGASTMTIAELDGADILALEQDQQGAFLYPWNFSADLGTEGYSPGLEIRARLGDDDPVTTGPVVAVGNDPPDVLAVDVPAASTEVVGIVDLAFTVEDDDELVDVRIEVNVDEAGGFPADGWALALPGGLDPETKRPDPTVPDVLAASGSGTERVFFWDVVEQYGSLDSGVRVRVTATDQDDFGAPGEESAPKVSATFRVDNNQQPVVSLDDVAFVQSDDQLFGIAVPFTVSDAEGDTVDLVWQWTREGEPFEELPDDDALIEEILADPALRQQYRIATPYPTPIAGLTRPTGEADTIELPELGSSQAHLLHFAQQPAGDLSGALDSHELELLRASKIPEPLAATWSADNPLNGPVAALPIDDGTTAWVLDRAGAGQWRVREIELATGAVLATLKSDTGEPDTMALERGGAALLVAAHDGSFVRICRIDLESLEVRAIVDAPGPVPGDTIRGLASLGTQVALATLGDKLLRLDYADPFATTVATVLKGLATPWGVLVDPSRSNRVYLAERDFAGSGRVLSVALDTRTLDPLPSAAPGLPHPQVLALERSGRLLVLTDETPLDGTQELRALELGSTAVSVLTASLPEGAANLATGPDGLRLLALGSANDLAASGGIVQVRTIVDYQAPGRVVTVMPPFHPVPTAGQPWRTSSPEALGLPAGSPRRGRFVWDSRDLWGGGRGLLRLTARDADPTVVEHDGGKPLLSPLEGLPPTLGGPATTNGPQSVVAADLDGDGDTDLVSANRDSDTLTVFLAASPGVYPSLPSATLGGPTTTNDPLSVVTADLDGDGDQDLVSANFFSDTLTVFLAASPGVYPSTPSATLGGPGMTDGPQSVAAADLDGDGDQDLVSANSFSDTLTVFLAASPGVYPRLPSATLGGPATTNGPRSVVAADLDGDGDADLVSANFNSNTLTVFLAASPGVYPSLPSATLGGTATTHGASSVAAADLDGDGDQDLVSANVIGDTLTVFLAASPGVYPSLPPATLGGTATTNGASSVVAADLDGDGDQDLVSANLFSDTLTVFLAASPGVYPSLPSATLGTFGTTDGTSSVTAADLDGDGDTDLVSANFNSDTLTVFLAASPGVYPSTPSLTLGGPATTDTPISVAAADLDGDGDQDLVSANQFSHTLTVFLAASPGVYPSLPSATLGGTATTNGASSVVAADLDGDGDQDLVSANLGSDTLTVFLAASPGVYPSTSSATLGSPATTNGPRSVVAADLDGDGDQDLVSANSFSDTLTVFLAASPGVYPRLPSATLGGPATTDGASSVAAADLDGDGDTDLVSANEFSDTLTVFLAASLGVYPSTPSLTLGGPATTDGPVSVAAADLDGDGDTDLVSANRDSDTLTVFLAASPGVYPSTPSATLGGPATMDGPLSVVAADLDGDGDQDLVSANVISDTLTVFYNAHAP